jgi:hypothetical protein
MLKEEAAGRESFLTICRRNVPTLPSINQAIAVFLRGAGVRGLCKEGVPGKEAFRPPANIFKKDSAFPSRINLSPPDLNPWLY